MATHMAMESRLQLESLETMSVASTTVSSSEIVSLARAAGIYAKGGRTGTCKGIFSKCMGAYQQIFVYTCSA